MADAPSTKSIVKLNLTHQSLSFDEVRKPPIFSSWAFSRTLVRASSTPRPLRSPQFLTFWPSLQYNGMAVKNTNNSKESMMYLVKSIGLRLWSSNWRGLRGLGLTACNLHFLYFRSYHSSETGITVSVHQKLSSSYTAWRNFKAKYTSYDDHQRTCLCSKNSNAGACWKKITYFVSTMTFEIFNPNSLEMFRLTSEDSGEIRQASHPVG